VKVGPRARRLSLWLPLAAAVAGGIGWLLRPQAVPVDFATVERGPLRVTISDEGEARVREVFAVSAPVPGFLRRIEIHAGDTVTAYETVVAWIEPSDPSFLDARSSAEARALVHTAEAARAHGAAEVRRAEAEDEFATAEHARIVKLEAQGVASQSALDAAARHARVARAALEEARAGLAARDSELAAARARLLAPRARSAPPKACDCVAVFSPVTGTVLRVVRESEGQILAGEIILEVGDPTNLEIAAELLSSDAVKVAAGQRALVDGWGGDRVLDAVVRRVEPFGITKVSALGIEEQRVNVLLDLTEPRERWQRLGHGFRVEVSIITWEADAVAQVPYSALFRDGEAWAVFAVVDGRAALRRVKIGHENGVAAEVLSGLSVGARVVVYPSDRVVDGARLIER
jgi:HlyD family secretion protein